MENEKFFRQYHLEDAWRQIRDVLFNQTTGMVYDYVTSRDYDSRFDHLPSSEEIAKRFPNPCGWGTGMEDCALNGGILLDLMCFPGCEDSVFSAKIAEGVILCGSVHGRRGFIARGISPRDGKSCYVNSSRDQFTLATYGMWKFLRGCLPSSIRKEGTEFLRSVADYCEKTVTPEHHYNLLRLDGKPALVSSLWNCAPHETMRLPMIYGIAWDVSGEKHYSELMNRYAEAGLKRTLALSPESELWDMPLLQMQLSLNFFLENGMLPGLREEIRQSMYTAALIAQRQLKKLLQQAESFSGGWGELYDNWRNLPMRIEKSPDDGAEIENGLNPVFRHGYACPNMFLRGIGNYLAVMAHSRDFLLPEQFVNRADRLIRKIDFMKAAGNGTIALVYGYGALSSYGKLSGMNPCGEQMAHEIKETSEPESEIQSHNKSCIRSSIK